MKNFKLLLAAAVVFGAGSAFTTLKSAPGEFVLDGGDYIPKDTAPGNCETGGDVCTYIWNGSAYVPQDLNENAHYER
ncbi:hypothetical protein [Flavobacterium lindanitolerans]|uniref:hypothetical protein n=1 Tax=Flavobacterium lindanitolerans TaxID=428988 RepID=UPI0027BB1BFF|nr:hypothetical protein [Flavobacterium lindanitolerans]